MSCDGCVTYLSLEPYPGEGPVHSREVPLRHMRDMFGDVSSKAHTDSYTNYPHFPVAYKVHHRMRRDN